MLHSDGSCILQDSWLYHITVAAGGGTGNVGTEFEQIISRLLEQEGETGMTQGCVYWKHPAMLHTKEPLTKPLTTLPSEDLQEQALILFKVSVYAFCLSFM